MDAVCCAGTNKEMPGEPQVYVSKISMKIVSSDCLVSLLNHILTTLALSLTRSTRSHLSIHTFSFSLKRREFEMFGRRMKPNSLRAFQGRRTGVWRGERRIKNVRKVHNKDTLKTARGERGNEAESKRGRMFSP